MLSVLRQASRLRVAQSGRTAVPAGNLRFTPRYRTLISGLVCYTSVTPDSNIFLAKRYTAEHETVSYDDETGLGTITITEHAQSSLGDVVFVELPALETKVAQGGELYLCTYT
jgi:glycine cleavage system H protein